MESRVNPYQVKSDWIDTDEAQAHFQASALTNQNVDDAFTSVAQLAYEHHLRATEEVLKASQLGEAVNLSAIRSNNFKLGPNTGGNGPGGQNAENAKQN